MQYGIHGLTKKPIFWIAFLLVCIIGTWFSLNFFSKAFPIINLEITMDRQQALEKARALATANTWGPVHYQQTASFNVDNETKNFIELEGGGISKFKEILTDPHYSPYTWSVRHFKEYEIHEVTIFFTPQGKLYGFKEQIAEDKEGPALTPEQAQAIAIAQATDTWHINFTQYAQVETSQETRPNGRIDHTFIYERTDKKIGEAPYRLTLVVSGDRLTQLKHSIKVPEAFTRRYKEMRSSNNIIAFIALAAVIIFYVFGGFLALFFLLRRRWLLWKIPLIFGFVIGILQAAVILNELPLYWIIYPTSLSLQSFINQILVQVLLLGCAYGAIATLIIMVAESLSRKAFGNHIQLWHIWGKTAGHSLQVLGRTLGGYLILGFDFAFAIGLYYITLRYFGWWSPSEELYNPNILAHYLPWLSPLALSLSAGLLEECLFRAVPLAGAALLGNKFGKRKLLISIAFIVQAIIFGAAHASYPAQPAYARLIELIIPSFIFGGIYLQFGLLPSIISHYIYDVVWFSLPIFVSSASTLFFDKIIIAFGILLPLIIIIFRLLQAKKITTLPSYLYNRAWNPPTPHEIISPKENDTKSAFITLSSTYTYSILVIGFVSLLLWTVTTHFKPDSLPVEIDRKKAIEIAQNTLDQSSQFCWKTLSNVIQQVPEKEEEQKQQHRFVWKMVGKKGYQQLLSENYIRPYAWFIRFVNFDGDVIARTEEYQITLRTTHDLIEKKHILAENTSLPSLSIEEARKKTLDFLENEFQLDRSKVIEISASPKKLPERIDWTFIYKIPSTLDLKDGQQRITITLAGDQISNAFKHIFVPESWKRNYAEQKAFKDLIKTIADFVLIIIILFALALLASHSNFNNFSWRTFSIFFGILFIKSCIQFFNIWPASAIQFSTIEPYSHQVWQTVLLACIISFAKALLIALLCSFIMPLAMRSPSSQNNLLIRILIALSVGIGAATLYSLALSFSHSAMPVIPDFSPAGAYLPALSAALLNLTSFIEKTILLMTLVLACDIFTNGLQQRNIYLMVCSILGGLITIGHSIDNFSLLNGLIAVFCIGLFFYISFVFIVRFDKVTLPWVTGGFTLLMIIQQSIFNAYPGALLGGILSFVVILSMIYIWMLELQKKNTFS